MDTATMLNLASAHKKAARRWDKAARLHAESLRAIFEAEAFEHEIVSLKVDTLKPVHKRNPA